MRTFNILPPPKLTLGNLGAAAPTWRREAPSVTCAACLPPMRRCGQSSPRIQAHCLGIGSFIPRSRVTHNRWRFCRSLTLRTTRWPSRHQRCVLLHPISFLFRIMLWPPAGESECWGIPLLQQPCQASPRPPLSSVILWDPRTWHRIPSDFVQQKGTEQNQLAEPCRTC